MQNATDKPELRVTVFSDYICPFCYIGDARLMQLRQDYDLKINWCFLEIHPETPAQGMPVSELGYTPKHWHALMETLAHMAEVEQIQFAEHSFTTNSRRALLLAEAAKADGRTIFYALHQRLFEAFFGQQANIGDPEVLSHLARSVGMLDSSIQAAWNDPRFETRLQHNHAAAHELNVRATPTFFIGAQRLDGAVPTADLRQAAQLAVQT